MDQRTPLKDLTGENVKMCKDKDVEKFHLSLASKPRISVIKQFDPLYASPLKFDPNQILSNGMGAGMELSKTMNISNSEMTHDDVFNNENVDPGYRKIFNLSTIIDDEYFIKDIREFAEGIILEAIDTVFANESIVNLNDTFYETADGIVLDKNLSNASLNESNDYIIENKERSLVSCTHDTEINNLMDYVSQLEKENTIKNEELIATEELLKIKDLQVQEEKIKSAKFLEQNTLIIDLEKKINDLEIMCKDKDEHIIKLEEDSRLQQIEHSKELTNLNENCMNNIEMQKNITKLEALCCEKDELITKLQEDCQNLKMQHEKELNSIQHINNDGSENSLLELQALCTKKDESIAELKESISQSKNEFELVMNSFERHIQHLLSEIKTVQNENVIAKGHLSNLEVAFSDVHLKYEKSKQIIDGYRVNEDQLRATLQIFEGNLQKYDEQVLAIKNKAVEHTKKLSAELGAAHERYHIEMSKLMSKIKHLEIKNSSLSNALEQKTQECQELTNLCEEVTGKGF